MKHLRHIVGGIVAVVVVVAPMAIANPSVQHYIEQHPAVAAYLPIALGVLRAAVKAWKEQDAPASAP